MQSNYRIALSLLPAFIVSCSPADDPSPVQHGADQVLSGGLIYTVDGQNPWAEAVAIKDGKFVYVGDDEGAAAFVSDSTRTTDLGGRLVIPGLIDGHTHPGYIDLERYGAFRPYTNHKDLIQAVKDYADSHPDEEWIRLCCWPNHWYIRGREGPRKEDLDAVVPDRPVWITSNAWHSYWLNSKALEKLGVNRDTPDPRTGIATYVRDENGEPTGWVKEGAAWQHLATQFPVDPEPQRKSIAAFLNTLSEHGVTTVYDAGNFDYSDHVYEFLAGLDRSGNLPLRYEGTFAIYVPERRDRAIAELKRLRDAYGGNRLRFNTIKLFMDGITENRSGGMLEPYSDDESYIGATMLTAEELRDFLLELHAEKLDLHIHAIGDLAVRTALDGIEAARAAVGDSWYPRVTIGHLEIIDPADWPRFSELDVSANYTVWWLGANYNETVSQAFGEERSRRTYTANSLFDNGANVTFSSDDWRLGVLSPFLGMQIAHNRQDPGDWLQERGGSMLEIRPPESEKLDLERMVKGYTINAAYPFRMENQIGSIEMGKLADLVVLDENLFEMDRFEIHKMKPSAVMMEGALIRGKWPGE